MSLDRLFEIAKKYWALVSENEWAHWGLLAIAAVAVFVLLVLILRRQLRKIYLARELGELTARELELTNGKSINLLQREIIKLHNSELSLEREKSDLTAINKRLQENINEFVTVKQQLEEEARCARESYEKKITELKRINKKLEQEIKTNKKASEGLKQQTTDFITTREKSNTKVIQLSTDNDKLLRELESSKNTVEILKKRIEELTAANEQISREVEIGKKAWERAKKKITDLKRANEKLQNKLVEVERASRRTLGHRYKTGVLSTQDLISVSEIGLKEKSPEQQLKELAEEIVDINLKKGISDNQDSKQKAIVDACESLDTGNVVIAVEALQRFISSVEAQQGENNGILNKEEAEDLKGAAQGIINLLVTE